MIDIFKIREDFPILSRKVNGQNLIYFDNAATSQTPQQVIDVITDYYTRLNSNIHRGVHRLSQEATDAYEEARIKIQQHFNVAKPYEIIFTSGTTESINLVASGFSKLLKPEDELVISALEHHSNIVPWQMLCEKTDAKLKVIPMTQEGTLDIKTYKKILNKKTKLVFVNHVSNALGTLNPVDEIIEMAHKNGAYVLIDGAQACAHIKPDLQKMNVDFYVTSAHKLCGPTGVGILYAKKKWLDELPPYQGGGGMIDEVKKDDISFPESPTKFEAGTLQTAEIVGFAESIRFIENIGIKNITQHEKEITEYGLEKLKKNNSVSIIGDPKERGAILSFTIKGIHPHDIATILDDDGVAIRAGHHCCQILHEKMGIPATARASLGIYNSKEDIDILNESINKCNKIFNN